MVSLPIARQRRTDGQSPQWLVKNGYDQVMCPPMARDSDPDQSGSLMPGIVVSRRACWLSYAQRRNSGIDSRDPPVEFAPSRAGVGNENDHPLANPAPPVRPCARLGTVQASAAFGTIPIPAGQKSPSAWQKKRGAAVAICRHLDDAAPSRGSQPQRRCRRADAVLSVRPRWVDMSGRHLRQTRLSNRIVEAYADIAASFLVQSVTNQTHRALDATGQGHSGRFECNGVEGTEG